MDPIKRKNTEATNSPTKCMLLDQTAVLDSEAAERTNADYSFHDLPLEIIGQIFSYIPGRFWLRLELVNHHFRSGILEAWRNLKDVTLEQFIDEESISAKGATRRRHILQSLLRMLYIRSPTVESISGFFAAVQSLDNDSLGQLSQFETLKSVCFTQCHVEARYLAEFLATSSSRSRLEELRICEPLGFTIRRETSRERSADDQAMREAVIDKPGRPSLKLKKVVCKENIDGYDEVFTGGLDAGNGRGGWDEFFTGLDVSVLESLSLTTYQVSSNCLTKLLARCTQLHELRWSHWSCCYTIPGGVRNRYGPQHPALSFELQCLDAFASLASANLRKLELYGLPVYSERYVANMLKRIAPVCQRLSTLIIRSDPPLGVGAPLINVLCENFPALETLHLDIYGFGAASLTNLVTRMDRMKRLAFSCPVSIWNPRRQISSDVLTAIVSHMKELESLCLQGLMISDDSSIVLSELEQLKELSLAGPDIPNPTVIEWCKTFGPQLEVLELSSPRISDSSIVTCAEDLGHVRRLSLNGTGITDLSLHALTKCDRLEWLDLSGCKGITKSGVQAVIDGCKTLVQLKLDKTPIKKADLIYDQRTNALNIIP